MVTTTDAFSARVSIDYVVLSCSHTGCCKVLAGTFAAVNLPENADSGRCVVDCTFCCILLHTLIKKAAAVHPQQQQLNSSLAS
jgi:hypothetical protein